MLQKKIVIVEDNLLTSAMLKEIVETRVNWNVVGTPNDADKGSEVIVRTHPDLVLLDLIMPPRDGFVVMENVRKHNINCKFLVLSSVKDENMISKALSMGASYYLTKPFDSDILVERIEDLLCLSGGTSTSRTVKWERQIEQDVYNMFIKMGMPATQSGFAYLRSAIGCAVNNPSLLKHISGRLYPVIAELYGVSEYVIERSIRFAIETTWQRGSPEYFNKAFGCETFLNDKPTNSAFLRMITDKMLMDHPRPLTGGMSSALYRKY